MSKDYSPFRPGQPAPVELFWGREHEVSHLRRLVGKATTGQLQVAFLMGERGIGKSSLAHFVRQLAYKEHDVVGVHTYLGGATTLEDMAFCVFDSLVKTAADEKWLDKVKGFFGKHIQQVGLFGITVEFKAADSQLRQLVSHFATSLKTLSESLPDDRRTLLIIMDDINGLASSVDFANWLKSLVDQAATGGDKLPLCLVVVGLPERRDSLVTLQPSLARVFDLVEIEPWSLEETKQFLSRAFAQAGMRVEEAAIDVMAASAGGLPVLAHEIGDAVYNVDEDGVIDLRDAASGVGIAADVVGRKHLEPQVFGVIQSAKYKTILRKMAGLGMSFTRQEVRALLDPGEVGVLDNFLSKMRDLGVVVQDKEAGRGHYHFPNMLHYMYFRMEAARANQRPLS